MMTEKSTNDKWKIRFGQIFQALLAKSGKKLEDYFYLLPSGTHPDIKTEKSFDLIDLNHNKRLYDRYFSSQVMVVPRLSKQTALTLDSTLVVVPGFGHHIIETKAFAEQMRLLEELDFDLLYTSYDDSFESIENSANRVYNIVKSSMADHKKIIFLSYSKGSAVVVKLLSDPRYKDVSVRTRAMVSFAGALRGSLLASLPPARTIRKLLNLYRQLSNSSKFTSKIRRKLLKWLNILPIKSLKNWHALVEKAFEFENDLKDLPDGIFDLTRTQAVQDFSRVSLPGTIKLFSLSAVIPTNECKNGFKFIDNADDLFLYVCGSMLHQHNVFNDTQLLLPDSEFFPGTGDIINLGIVKADHWGIALPQVFSKKYRDSFPRTEMLSAVLLTLDEYFNPSP